MQMIQFLTNRGTQPVMLGADNSGRNWDTWNRHLGTQLIQFLDRGTQLILPRLQECNVGSLLLLSHDLRQLAITMLQFCPAFLWPVMDTLKQLISITNKVRPYVYWTVHHLDSWVQRDQLDVTCFIISLFNAQHISDFNTSILRSLRLICWVISCVVLLWFDVCWCCFVVWLGWCGIRMQA